MGEKGSVEDTPGSRALAAMKSLQDEALFKIPDGVPKKKRLSKGKSKILDEDTYIEEMGKIIQRDFFPDLEKLKAQNEYLEAVDRNDIAKMRELHLKYSGTRPPTERYASPATFETPADVHQTPRTPPRNDRSPVTEVQAPVNVEETASQLSLDEYLASHTSEDNQSFSEIMLEAEKKHRQKYSYLYKEELKSIEEQQKLLALPSVEQQCRVPEKRLNIDSWTYKNKNYIMYIPDGVDLTKEQLADLNKNRKEIVHGNTRLTTNPFNEEQSKETINEIAKSQAKVLDGRIGVDGKELTKTDSPKIRGYGFLRTPSPCPDAMASPLMTWGEIEGTPFRLDGGDTPIRRSQGPSFKMAEPPRREQLALALAEKAGERHRDRKQKAIEAARRQFATPSPRSSSSTSERLASMSPAARKLIGLRSPSDLALRASYSPSPKRLKTPLTPSRIPTPGIRRIGTPGAKGKILITNNLTDNLLNINVEKRRQEKSLNNLNKPV